MAEQGERSSGEALSIEDARLEIAAGDATAVDVRSEEEWGQGHVPGAIHLPDGDPESATNPLEDGARLVVIAADAKAAKSVASDLGGRGYDAVAMDGGMKNWISEGHQIQPTVDPDEDTELGLG
jgi:rhodanese-related sulfurtransferase